MRSSTAPRPTVCDDFVAAARTSRRERRAVMVALPDSRGWRTYLPHPFGAFFESEDVVDITDPDALLAIAARQLAAGDGDNARGVLAYIVLELMALNDEQMATLTRLHKATHLYRCCSSHGVHTTPHRGCILR